MKKILFAALAAGFVLGCSDNTSGPISVGQAPLFDADHFLGMQIPDNPKAQAQVLYTKVRKLSEEEVGALRKSGRLDGVDLNAAAITLIDSWTADTLTTSNDLIGEDLVFDENTMFNLAWLWKQGTGAGNVPANLKMISGFLECPRALAFIANIDFGPVPDFGGPTDLVIGTAGVAICIDGPGAGDPLLLDWVTVLNWNGNALPNTKDEIGVEYIEAPAPKAANADIKCPNTNGLPATDNKPAGKQNGETGMTRPWVFQVIDNDPSPC